MMTTELTYTTVVTGLIQHRFELHSSEDGLVGECLCGYVFTCGFDMMVVWDLISEHCEPIA